MYISHEDFKNLMSKFQKETPKGMLKEGWNYDEEGEEYYIAIENDLESRFDRGEIDKATLDNALAYVSNHDYDLYSDNLDADYVLYQVAKGMKEGNAFTAALAKAKKGEKVKVDGEEITDTSDYDDPSVKEYSYTDNYPGSWGYRENKEGKNETWVVVKPNGSIVKSFFREKDAIEYLQKWDPKGERGFEIEKKEGRGVKEDAVPDDYSDPSNAQSGDTDAMNIGEGDMEEGLHTPPLQATGPTISTVENSIANPPMGFQVLSPDERDQLREYIKTVKTVKEEIKKLVSKAKGKTTLAEDMGGDRTGLVMTPSTTSEDKAGEEMAGDPEKEAQIKASLIKKEGHSEELEGIESKINPKLYSITEKVIEELIKGGLTPGEIKLWIQHEIEEKAKESVMSQYDPF